MKILSAAFMGLLFFTSFVSCKKNDPDPTLVGKWKIFKVVEKDDGQIIDAYIGKPTDYIDFKMDNRFESSVDGSNNSGSYSINGNIVTIDGDNFTIQDLTNTNVTLYEKYTENGSIIEMLYYLIK